MIMDGIFDPEAKQSGEDMNEIKMVMVGFLMLSSLSLLSCAGLSSESNPDGWRYAPFDDTPPSWENDIGRPPDDQGYYGEESW